MENDFCNAEALNIPGMIEPVEQQTLYALARTLDLGETGQIVEFGTFFGRSTNCLAQGLSHNVTRTQNSKLYAYDSFQCLKDGSFAPHVLSNTQRGNIASKLEITERHINFEKVFGHYLKSYIDSNLVLQIRSELAASEPGEMKKICLLHIDSPKFFNELRIILEKFFSLINHNGIIIFQDFFYHWSGSLIAAIEWMRQAGLVTFQFSAASSLVVKMCRKFSLDDLTKLDDAIVSPERICSLIQETALYCQTIQIDRPASFLPRLPLAAFQVLWESGDTQNATSVLLSYATSQKAIEKSVINDFLEMMRFGFTVREEYLADHS
jgi:hypothetical protein